MTTELFLINRFFTLNIVLYIYRNHPFYIIATINTHNQIHQLTESYSTHFINKKNDFLHIFHINIILENYPRSTYTCTLIFPNIICFHYTNTVFFYRYYRSSVLYWSFKSSGQQPWIKHEKAIKPPHIDTC